MTRDEIHVSDLMRSDAYARQSDDRLKDEDNAAWVMKLPGQIRDDWLTTLEWGRVADRLIENAVFGDDDARTAGALALADFSTAWKALRAGEAPATSQFGDLMQRLEERWSREGLTEAALHRWDMHLDALWRYRHPDGVILCADDLPLALQEMSGTFFQACPYQPDGLGDAVGALGALDQFFNNLRDLREDTLGGICYLPPDLLALFGIDRSELGAVMERADPRMEKLFGHLLSTVVPELRLQAAPLFSASGLHESWVEMLHSVSVRHSRIEYTARLCRFNAAAFSETYWLLVAQDLAQTPLTRRR